nr:MAG TPA: hypothetical protein [Caudoviricetes sp.]
MNTGDRKRRHIFLQNSEDTDRSGRFSFAKK